VNFDPPLDVRDTMGSGMPFRWAIEDNALNPTRFVELGTGRFSNLSAHLEWATAQGVRVVGFDDAVARPEAIREALAHAMQGGKGFVSIDLDVLDGSIAPGVSAVCPNGVPLSMATTLAELAGLHPGVVHFDIMELSPIHDEPPWGANGRPGRTARVAALILLHFLSGLSRRVS
jgi:formiminoglutamase